MQNFLLQPISIIGKSNASLMKYLIKLVNGDKIFDLLIHKPVRVERVLMLPKIYEVKNDELVLLKGKIESHQLPQRNNQPFKALCYNPSGYFNLVFFKTYPALMPKIKIGNEVAVIGKIQKINSEFQIVHPSDIYSANDIEKMPKFNVIYPLNSVISQKFLIYKIKQVLQKLNFKNDEWIDVELIKKEGWYSLNDSLKKLHNPISENDFNPNNKIRRRIAYDELLAWQIALLMSKNRSKKNKKLPSKTEDYVKIFISSLPFKITESQLKAINEINTEIISNKKMLRLLQGDVGSGKTIVAISSCLEAISCGKQCCVLVPTTVLAKQHFQYFCKFLKEFNFNIEIITSSTTKKQRKSIQEKLINGEINIVISTHAILEDDIKFYNLGLVIIDEQHRFGVLQRLKLINKGEDVDTLLMSATPIPRSLMMGLYGDMDISILSQKPQNRQPIETLIMSTKKSDQLYDSLRRAIEKGEKIYWICPAIEKNDESSLIAVNEKYIELTKVFGSNDLGLLHGKLKENDKEKIMQEFAKNDGTIKMLVSTTVIEVGIDVPSATIIVIDNAENFGLAQLHQLRGRVGRSDKKSFCILLYGEKYGITARSRLNILKQSNDGFYIAEEDLRLRGSGELVGTRQSGFPEFKIADLNFDSDLLKEANKQSKLIIDQDPNLSNQNNFKYKNLLSLFGYEECLKIVSSG